MMPVKSMRVFILSAFFAAQAWLGCRAEPQPITVPVCATPPQLDADLKDPAWGHALKLTGFHRVGSDQPPEAQTTVWLCRDDTWFYIAFRCDENKAGSMVRSETRRDGKVSSDDSVEVFLDLGTGGREYRHFQLSAGNVQADQWCSGKNRMVSWNLPWRSAARRDPHIDTATGWSAEMALPLAMLQEGGGSKPWMINICRTRKACTPTEYTSLAVLPAGASFHTPEAFIPIQGLSDFKARTPFGPMVEDVAVLPLKMTDGGLAYGLEVKVKNKTGKAGAVEVVGEDRPQEGAPKMVRETVNLGPMDEKNAELWFPVESLGQRDAWVGLRESGSEFWLQRVDVPDLDRLRPFEAYPERNYYTAESNAVIWVEMRNQPSERSALRIRAVLEDGRGKAIQAQEADAQADEIALPFALAGLPPGTYPVTISLVFQHNAKDAPAPVMGKLRVNLKKLPPAPDGGSEVKIDHYNRCLLFNGEPFFPLGQNGNWYRLKQEWQRKAYLANLKNCQAAGWNVVQDWAGYNSATNVGLDDIKQRYALIAEHGLKIIGRAYPDGLHFYFETNFTDRARAMMAGIDPYLDYCRRNPNLLAYYHIDEPPPPSVLDLTGLLQEFTDKMRRLDPYHPVYMSLSSYLYAPQWFGTVSDLLGTHNFWYASAPDSLHRQAEYQEQKDRLSRKMHLPTVSVVQNENWQDDNWITPHEIRATTYLALVHGAKALIYFPYMRLDRSVPVYRQLSSEIMALAPALLKREPRQEITWAPLQAVIPGVAAGIELPVLQTTVREYPDGRQVLLAVNASFSGTVTVQYAVSSCAEGAAVERLFAKAAPLKVSGGSFADAIEPLGARAYQWQPAGRDRAAPVRVRLTLSGPAVDDLLRKPAPDGAGANLLANPGFETAADWEKLQRSTETVCAGAQAAVLVKTNSNGVLDVVSLPVTLAPQTSYRFGGWVKADLREGRQLPYIFVYSKTPVQGVARVNAQALARKWDGQWQEVAGSFTTPAEPAETIQVFLRLPPGSVGTAWFDDVYVRPLPPPKVVSKNLMRNSGFETARIEGFPSGWSLTGGLETNNPVRGRYCARIVKPASDQEGSIRAIPVAVQPEKPYTLSFYARADDPGMEIAVYGLGGPGAKPTVFPLTAKWERSQVTFIPQRSPIRVALYPGKTGVFYVDAVQLEEGAQATDYEPDDYSK